MLPNLLICGVNKAGTSSLFTYLNEHPKNFGSTVKETCYYLPLVFNQNKAPISQYEKFFSEAKALHQYRFEATPGYFYGGEFVANQIKSDLGEVKIILLFREPVNRAFSFFKHLKGKLILNATADFNKMVKAQLTTQEFRTVPLKENQFAARMLRDGFYDKLFAEWLTVFGKDNVYVGFLENFENNPKKEVSLLCSWLNIDDQVYTNYQFQIDNKSLKYQNNQVHKLALFAYKKFEVFFRRNKTITLALRNFYQKLNAKNFADTIQPSTAQELSELYAPSITAFKHQLQLHGYTNLPNWIINSK